jgi:N-methylhydantoinase A
VTTKGFRDVPFIQRGNRKSHYDMSWVKPKPLVKRRHCFELNERIDAYGQVVTPLDDAEVRDVSARIAAIPEAVAICLLFLLSQSGARAPGARHPAGGAVR